VASLQGNLSTEGRETASSYHYEEESQNVIPPPPPSLMRASEVSHPGPGKAVCTFDQVTDEKELDRGNGEARRRMLWGANSAGKRPRNDGPKRSFFCRKVDLKSNFKGIWLKCFRSKTSPQTAVPRIGIQDRKFLPPGAVTRFEIADTGVIQKKKGKITSLEGYVFENLEKCAKSFHCELALTFE